MIKALDTERLLTKMESEWGDPQQTTLTYVRRKEIWRADARR